MDVPPPPGPCSGFGLREFVRDPFDTSPERDGWVVEPYAVFAGRVDRDVLQVNRGRSRVLDPNPLLRVESVFTCCEQVNRWQLVSRRPVIGQYRDQERG